MSLPGPNPERSGERGGASVEFAAVLPFVAIAMLLVIQVALLVSQQLRVAHAAREGARQAAVWNDDERAREAALRAGALDPDRTEVDVSPAERPVGSPVRVTVRYRPAAVVPFVGPFVPAVTLSASVEMRVEREPSPTPSPSPSPSPTPEPSPSPTPDGS